MKQIQIVNAINDEPITTIDIPASERLKLVDLGNDDPGRPAGALQSLWLVADGQEVDGMRVSLVGCSANNLIIDLTGANVSGMQIMLAGAAGEHVIIDAKGFAGDIVTEEE